MNRPYDPDEHDDLANPRPRRGTLALLAIIVGLLVLGATIAALLLARQ